MVLDYRGLYPSIYIPMKAFHGDPAVKKKYVDRLKEHRRQEHLVRGYGWVVSGGFLSDGAIKGGVIKGCAVGCTLENYNHSQYPIELGLPEWIAHLEDIIFEGLPKRKAEKFAVDLLKVIPVGADLAPVRNQLNVARVELILQMEDSNKLACYRLLKAALRFYKTLKEAPMLAELRRVARLLDGVVYSAHLSRVYKLIHDAVTEAHGHEDQSTAVYRTKTIVGGSPKHYQWEAKTLLDLLAKSCK